MSIVKYRKEKADGDTESGIAEAAGAGVESGAGELQPAAAGADDGTSVAGAITRLCPQKRHTNSRLLSCGHAHSLHIQHVLCVGFSVHKV